MAAHPVRGTGDEDSYHSGSPETQFILRITSWTLFGARHFVPLHDQAVCSPNPHYLHLLLHIRLFGPVRCENLLWTGRWIGS